MIVAAPKEDILSVGPPANGRRRSVQQPAQVYCAAPPLPTVPPTRPKMIVGSTIVHIHTMRAVCHRGGSRRQDVASEVGPSAPPLAALFVWPPARPKMV